jgi:hypothetical protein
MRGRKLRREAAARVAEGQGEATVRALAAVRKARMAALGLA